ncbi:MAG TPA: DNA replication/repair protein RecF [Clostridiales bacterium]|nr:DNA replication/repair protein RecF [Clostridiales bacterium]
MIKNCMFLKRILLENYRNYTSLDLSLSNDVNIFYGNNGQGKTNLLEAIFYTAIGKSFRNAKDSDVIQSGKEAFRIDIEICSDITENISVKYNKNKEKYIKVNGLYLRKLGHLMGSVLAVIFSPEDMQLISEGPSVRRKFMDIAISQKNASYYFDLLQYQKILVQKNNLLRNIKCGKVKNYGEILSIWNEQLAESGSRIVYERFRLIKDISEIAEEKHRKIAVESAEREEKLKIFYHSDIPREIIEAENRNTIKNELFSMLENRREKEIEREATLFGPHRDDIDLKLDENDLKRFGSQGQKRTAVLALKIAELELLKKSTGRNPIFLLDDVFSELDHQRQEAFLSEICGVQTFISCVEAQSIPFYKNNAAFYEIKNGSAVL